MFAVLILIYVLQGGLVGSHAVIAPDFATCVANAPAIIAQESQRGTVLDPQGQPRKIVRVIGQCVEVPGAHAV